ncbi:sigma 54-interacting transcriptional regulator [Pedobacter sp. AW1-32]|uniref:sigma 54-interacting transcriptional regulator n=1 Tax=Pedobacter sp. AW1-32 TaxID=3383026 RepID=UPI003FF11B4D
MKQILIVEDEFIVAHELQMILQRAGYQIKGIADSYNSALTILEKDTVDLVLLDIYLKGKQTGIDLAQQLMSRQIPFIYISANSNEKVLEAAKSTLPYGFIVKPYRERDILMSIDIARYRKENSNAMKNSSAVFMKDFIVDISMKSLSWQKKLLSLASAFQPYIPFDFIALSGMDYKGKRYNEIGITRENFDQYDTFTVQDFLKFSNISQKKFHLLNQLVPETTQDAIYINHNFEAVKEVAPMKKLMAETYTLNANLVKTFSTANGDRITFSFYSRMPSIYTPEHLELLQFLSPTLENKLNHIIELTEAGYTPEHNQPYRAKQVSFENIIGKSTSILTVLDKLSVVAPTDTSVMITGESGTGKEEIARSIHRLSPRKDKPMIAVNCAALPADLIESILFGHEKGAFTGALNKRIGKFEEANGGTIFLDEIGEMPIDLQAKLLRVLQEKEIERIGGKTPVAVNIRIIAATNLHLEKEIAKGRFRLDLFFRLNVFPLHIPPLRQRKSDILLLVDYFIEKHAKSLSRQIHQIDESYKAQLMYYNWPGNIRELEHVIVRSLILSNSGVLDASLLDLGLEIPNEEGDNTVKTISENERDHIVKVLQLCKGKISGSGGAAELLGIPATTLNSRMKKLGIEK